MNLAVQDTLAHIAPSLKKIKLLPQKIKKMKSSCSNITDCIPILDVVTRWSSTHTMIAQAIEIRQVEIRIFEYLIIFSNL